MAALLKLEELIQFQFVELQACGGLKSSSDAKAVSTSTFP